MINNLFPPYPDEIFYGFVGRYHSLSGNPSVFYTLLELFNLYRSKGENINISYPVNLSFLCSQIPSSFNISPDDIIKNNTLFPFFQPFLPKNIADLVLKGMKGKTNFHLNDMMGANSIDLFTDNIVKICKKCVKEDIANIGEGYIHRTHQIPGCFICNKHHIPLEYIDLTQTKYFNNFFILDDIIDKSRPFIIDNKIFNNLLQLTLDISYLTSKNLDNYDLEKIRKNYSEKLMIEGYSNFNGRIIKSKIQNNFLSFYNKNYLIFLNSDLNSKMKYNWLYYISKNRVEKIHPIRHLLFIRFLFGGIKEFINFNEEYEPFGKSPWPCLNIQCNHYKLDTINSYELLKSRYRDKIYGRFKCSKCGFIYTRCGPDIDTNDRYIINTVEEYGHAWEKELTDLLINYNYCVETLRKKLKCSAGSIISYVCSHNLVHYLTENDQIKIQSKPNKDLIAEYKNAILQYIKNNKKATRSKIYSTLNKECALVIIRDNEWYNKVLPAPLKKELNCQVKGDLVNWSKRDLELSKKVIEAINEIKENTDFRISKNQLAARTDSTYITKPKYLSKLPITQKIINDSIESNDDYLKRKCDYIIKYLFNKGQTITAGQLRIKLKITINNNENLNNYIEESLLKYTF